MTAARPDLNGHKAIAANTCYNCGGVLKNSDGSFYERTVESGSTRAFAAAICASCAAQPSEFGSQEQTIDRSTRRHKRRPA